MALELDVRFPGFSPPATQALLNHHWPGNVRELKNTAERAMFHWAADQNTSEIESVILDPFAKFTPGDNTTRTQQTESSAAATSADNLATANLGLREMLHESERAHVERALHRHHGQQKPAAKALQLSYDQLRGIIRKHDIDVKQYRAKPEILE